MKTKLLTSELKKKLQVLSRAVSNSPTLPILGCIYIKADKEEVLMKTSNISITMQATMQADTQAEGVVAIPAKMLFDIVKKNTDDYTSIELKSDKVIITAGAKYKVSHMDAEQFPKVEYDDGQVINIPAYAIEQVAFAAGADNNEQYLGTVCFDLCDTELTMVATNKFRLACKTISLPEQVDNARKLIVARELLSIIKSIECAEVSIVLGEQHAMIYADGITAFLRIVNSDYINYKPILSKEKTNTITIKREELRDALDRAKLMADKYNSASLTFSNCLLEIKANNPSLGEVSEEIDGEWELDFKVAADIGFFLDVLNVLETPNVELKVETSTSPMFVCAEEDNSYKYLIMPVHLKE